ncbi:MAG: rubrerythrin family protein [Candidatus ainarchaeum sp.]|nr:rubrerythrin family protein [Candidatus ainarchaeum sp.]MDD3975596.1 rubrerythrin family protein [Candidatus ainarchaeum sp.]
MNKTILNLANAYVGECQARNRYTFYAKIAKKEGFEKITEVFEATATQETEHAKWLFRLLNSLLEKNNQKFEDLKLEVEVPTTLGNTKENLKSAIKGENFENTTMYPDYSKIAREEGLDDIADRLKSIAVAEKHHEDRFSKLLKEIENNTMFEKENKVYWICRKCGYLEEGTKPPEKCPSCDHPYNYFEKQCEDY